MTGSVIGPIVAFLAAWGIAAWLASEASPFRIMDAPGDRSLHTNPTPRGGGLGILGGIAAATIFQSVAGGGFSISPTIAGAAMIAAISFADDLKNMPATLRLSIHILASGLLVWGLKTGAMPLWIFALLVLTVVWMINLYNFMDGMDGLAGGMGVWGFGFLSVCGWLAGRGDYALSALVIASANLGFLFCNFPPARIFMGDVGSATMGFLAAAFSLKGVTDGWLPWEVPALIFSPFIVDATVTLLGRAFRGERFWEAHRTHYYQRLVQSGWSHRSTVLAEYALMTAAGLSAALLMKGVSASVTRGMLAAWIVIYVGAAALVRSAERTRKSAV